MAKSDLRKILDNVATLGMNIDSFVPLTISSIEFRADLAGLLVVAMAAAYETCVKETLVGFATRHHVKFGHYAENQYAKLNSRIRLSDLYTYCRTYDQGIHERFGKIVKSRKRRFSELVGRDFSNDYNQILNWRHDFAHERRRNTTVEEALVTHRCAKLMLYSFDDAFQ